MSADDRITDKKQGRRWRTPALLLCVAGTLVLLLVTVQSLREPAALERCIPDDERPAPEAGHINMTFESGRLFPPYGEQETQGTGDASTLEVVDAPERSGKAVRLAMPPSRGVEADVPSRRFVYPTPDLRWNSGDDAWYGISIYVDEDWDLNQIGDTREHFLAMFSMRWTDLSTSKNGPGNGIGVDRVAGDSVPHFVADRETRGWDYPHPGDDRIDLGPVVKGEWIDFVIHIKWSASPDSGVREYWRDGKLMGRSTKQNMGTDAEVHHRMGIYQGTAVDHERRLYWDNHRVGNSYAEVNPACA